METPVWLSTKNEEEAGQSSLPRRTSRAGKERFIDKTLRHVLSFIEDSMFSENIAKKRGLLQGVEPRLKIVTLLFLVVVLSLQKSIGDIVIFLFLSFALVAASRISLPFFLKKLLPAAIITLCISLPVVLNLVVKGKPLIVLFRFERPVDIGPLIVPDSIEITEQGLKSALTLLFRVVASVSFVFLMIMTTRPNTFMKSVASLIPGPLSSVVSMGYRYIYLLARKTEQFIMGLRSRQIVRVTSGRGQRWAASRMGLLFSISMDIANELAMSMESRGYRGDRFRIQDLKFKMGRRDVLWLIFVLVFCGVMTWKSLA
jgi:cobalt/nickel transport system permease protein